MIKNRYYHENVQKFSDYLQNRSPGKLRSHLGATLVVRDKRLPNTDVCEHAQICLCCAR